MRLGKSYRKLWWATAISNLGDGVAAVAYPWIASAVTRSPLLIAIAAVASQLPRLIFTLPAGVITDRFDRRKIIVAMDLLRGGLTLFVAFAVLSKSHELPNLNDLKSLTGVQTNVALYLVIIFTAFLFGMAEILRDNTAQTLMPSIVEDENLEKANGRMWSAESLTNSFIGPPLGSLLIAVAIFLPVFFNAATFFVGAALIASITNTLKPLSQPKSESKINFRAEIKEGFSWLWKHELLRPLAIIAGSVNGVISIIGATSILFAQEVLHTSVLIFAILGTAGAVGGILGGTLGPKLAAKIGSGSAITLALIVMPATVLIIGLMDHWYFVWALTAALTFVAVLGNIVILSLRQRIIPAHLLGRVNSVYRLFAGGSMPIGVLIGGVLVTVNAHFMSREWALRSSYLVAAALGFIILVIAAPKLTTAKIEAARGNPKINPSD